MPLLTDLNQQHEINFFINEIVEMGFILPVSYPRDSTFHHFNGHSSRRLTIFYLLDMKIL